MMHLMRKKDKNGLTHQQELFCQYVVDAYGTDTRGVLVNAYRKAYNCKSDAKTETHYSHASVLANKDKIRARIEELKRQQAERKTIEREDVVTRNVKILDLDPLEEFFKIDEITGKAVPRKLHEIRKEVRKLLNPVVVRGGTLVWLPDKKDAQDKLIGMLGFEKAKDINVAAKISKGELCIGFDDDEE